MAEPTMSNRQVENVAIELVIAREHAAGRSAVDTRGRNAVVDVEGDLLIEVKAYSGSARGSDLWLEPRQVQAALDNPDRFHLIIVDNINTPAPRLLDIWGAPLTELLSRRREKHYFEVPLPTTTYDTMAREADQTH